MSKHQITDEQVARALGVYAGMADRVLSHPERWLGLDEDPPPSAPFPAKAVDAVRDRAFGELTPASPEWTQQPAQKRVDWWVTRIQISAGLAAAAPRFAGVLADRVPLQSALGASAAGLAVCATAREYGRPAPAEWIPLLAKVLCDRDLAPTAAPTPAAEESERNLTADTEPDLEGEGGGGDDGADANGSGGGLANLGQGARRAATTLWRLARSFLEVQNLLDERPRGSIIARGLAKIPVVGVAGGWMDERGAIRKASRQTGRLLGET